MVDNVAVRVTCMLSVLGSVYLLVRVLSRPRKTVLAKQVAHLAAVDLVTFTWEMLAPSTPCAWHEDIFKFLLAISIATELAIAIGMLMVVLRCQWVLRHGLALTLLVWPVVAFAYIWYFESEPAIYDAAQGFCVGTQFQVDMELVYGWSVLFVVGFLYLVTFCMVDSWSPGSVARSHLRYARSFLLGYCVVCVPYGIFLLHVREHLGGRMELDRTFYLVGHVAICSNGLVNALVYSLHSFRGRGDDSLASFAVAFEDMESIMKIEGNSLQAMLNAESEAKAMQERRRNAYVLNFHHEASDGSEDLGVSEPGASLSSSGYHGGTRGASREAPGREVVNEEPRKKTAGERTSDKDAGVPPGSPRGASPARRDDHERREDPGLASGAPREQKNRGAAEDGICSQTSFEVDLEGGGQPSKWSATS